MHFFHTLERSVAARGVLGTLRQCLCALARRLAGRAEPSGPLTPPCELDQRLGIDTSGAFVPPVQDVRGSNWRYGTRYQGIDPELFGRVFNNLRLDFPQFTFVDLGSGKGRALLLAAQYPFRKIIGVEYSRGLHETARRNLARCADRIKLGAEIQTVCQDAVEFVLPSGPLVLFLYNPFGRPVMAKVVARVVGSLRADSRRMVVTYFNPEHADVWTRTELFHCRARSSAVAIYDTEPGA